MAEFDYNNWLNTGGNGWDALQSVDRCDNFGDTDDEVQSENEEETKTTVDLTLIRDEPAAGQIQDVDHQQKNNYSMFKKCLVPNCFYFARFHSSYCSDDCNTKMVLQYTWHNFASQICYVHPVCKLVPTQQVSDPPQPQPGHHVHFKEKNNTADSTLF